MAVGLYRKTALTGGGSSALDGIDGDSLSDGYICLTHVQSGSNFIEYVHYLDADSGAAESSPSVIAPDTNPGSKRWHLLETALLELIFTNKWKIAPDGDDLVLYYDNSGWVEHWRWEKPIGP